MAISSWIPCFVVLQTTQCVAQTLAAVATGVAQDVLPLLQDLLQRRLQFAGQDAVLVAQLEATDRKSVTAQSQTLKHHSVCRQGGQQEVSLQRFHSLIALCL